MRDYGKIIDRLMDIILVSLILFLPVFSGSVHIWAYTLMEAAALTLMALWLVKVLLGNANAPQRDIIPLLICIIVFAGIVALQIVPLPKEAISLLSPNALELLCEVIPSYCDTAVETTQWRTLSLNPYLSRIALIKILSYGSVFFLIVSLYRSQRRVRLIVITLILAGFLEALYGLYTFFTLSHQSAAMSEALTNRFIVYGTFVNRNHFAGYVGMLNLFALCYFLRTKTASTAKSFSRNFKLQHYLSTSRGIRKFGTALMLITMMLALFLSRSRMGIICLLLSFILIAAMNFKKIRRVDLYFFAGLLSLGIISVGVIGFEPIATRFTSSYQNFHALRLPIWTETLKLIKDYSILGSGLDTYSSVFQLYAPSGITMRFAQAHNDYLEAISEMGFLGVIPLGTGILYFTALLIKRLLRQANPISREATLGGLVVIFYMALFSITDFNLQMPANAMTFVIILATAYCAASKPPQDDALKQTPPLRTPAIYKATLTVPFIIFAMFLFGFSINNLRSELAYPLQISTLSKNSFKVNTKSLNVTEERGSLEALRRAASLTPSNSRYHILLGRHYANKALREPSLTERANLFELSEAEYALALSYNPSAAEVVALMSWANFSKGDFLGGVNLLDTSLSLLPNRYISHLIYAQSIVNFIETIPPSMRRIYMYRAIKEFEVAIELFPALDYNPSIQISRAKALIYTGTNDAALPIILALRQYDSKSLELHILAVNMLMSDAKVNEAIKIITRLLSAELLGKEETFLLLRTLKKNALPNPEHTALRQYAILSHAKHELWQDVVELSAPPLKLAASPSKKSEIFYFIGLAHEMTGNLKSAETEYSRSLLHNKNNKVAREKLRGLLRKQ